MESITIEQLALAGFAIIIFYYFYDRRRDKDGRLPDLAVTRNTVVKIINNFEFTGEVSKEADAQKQLLRYFQDEFHHVQGQKPIGGIHAKQIDFDIGRERVGIEIKMAKSLFKKAEFDRLHGQMRSYSEAYPNDNLILLIFGTKAEMRNRIKHTAVKEALEDYPVHYEFIEI